MKKPVLLLIFLSILSCEKDLSLTSNYEGDVLVLNAQVTSRKIQVSLSRTANIKTPIYYDSLRIRNGMVQLFEEDSLVDDLTNLGDGDYEISNLNF